MTVDDYKITKDDNNTILITDNYGISYRVDINNYNLGEHTYLYENTRQTADDYSTYGGYVYSKGITQGNSIGVTFPNTLVQSAVTQSTLDPTKKKYHTTEQFREIASDSTEQFMKNLPGLIGKVTGNTNTTTTISSTTAPNYTVVTRGWSGGTQPAVELAAANGSSVAVMIDPNKAGEIEKNNFGLEPPPQEIYQALKENGTVIVSIKGKERTANIATYTEMKAIDNGVPVYVVKNNVESNHTKLEDFARKTRVDAFLSGEISYEQYVANCRANGYNPNNISLLKVTGYDTNGVSITEPISFNDYETGAKVTPTSDVIAELKDTYGDLANFAAQYQGSGDTLGSNLAFVSDAMNAINSQITEHTDINYISDGEASIVGTLYKASNYYGAVTNVLYGNLSAETEAVYAIANAIFQMDGAAAYIADTTLSDGMKGLFSRGNASVATALNELKTTSANLLDTAKNAVAAGGRYDELSSLLGTTIQEGGVGRISTKSLETAISTIIPNLENEIAKATGIKASVSEFMTGIGTSNILQGETWEAVKTNMANYENLLDCNVKAATFISDTIKTAMGMITNYISGAAETLRKAGTTEFASGIALDEIDDSKLPALEAELVKLQTEIDRLTAIVSTMEASRHEVEDKKQNEEGVWIVIGTHQEPSEEEIQVYRDQLTKVQDIKDILDAYAGVLRGFAPVVKGAQDIINDAVSQVKSAYENPTVDTQGNQTFSSNFSLDLSKYGIDSSIDYKKLAEEYHSDTSPEPASDTTNPDDKNEDGTQQNPETDKAGDNGTDKNPSNPGSPSPGGPASTPSTPSRNTEREPERTTEIQTKPIEVPTMAPTEPRRETEKPQSTESGDEIVIPDTQPPVIEIKDEPEVVRMSSGEYNKKPTNHYVDPLVNPDEPIIVDNQDEIIQNQIEEPIIDTGHNEYYEPEIQKPPVVEITPEAEQIVKPGTGVKTMGAASGVGVAIGALALGAYSIMKNKDKHDEEEEDYGYDK